jgi:hypothetical protein
MATIRTDKIDVQELLINGVPVLDISGGATFAGDVIVQGDLTVSGSIIPGGTGALVVDGDLEVTGSIIGGGSGTPRQEEIATEDIAGTDTALSAGLSFTPIDNASLLLFLNGVFQRQGAGLDYTVSGTTITWLASSGTAVDMATSDILSAVYGS